MEQRNRATRGAFGLLVLLLLATHAAHAEEGAVCEARPAPARNVSLILLASPQRVHTLAASIRDADVVVRDEKTVIFADGRVITADVARVGEHLTALGWADRKIEVMASFKPRAATPRRYG